MASQQSLSSRTYDSLVREVRSLRELPSVPAVYAMYEQAGSRPAYVGIANKLKTRVRQHLVLRDSSVTTGSSVVSLNPDQVRVVAWWKDRRFSDKSIARPPSLSRSRYCALR